MMRPAVWSAVAFAVAVARADAAIVTETYTDRNAFASRLGGAIQTITFDDVDTGAVDPMPFAPDRYAPFGLIVTGDAGQYASRGFGFPSEYPVNSPPNAYAPGPIESVV